ncbi:E3 ubiquitin/ISG15 ligase TRIM25 isoform X1 [Megalops cyprinoides]|uniref:E3 ubiquitin/ISG15 ligase TRIM25 isoform X1 n=1 Tax=Megalops cyprinoides TaxID=118141 RepID=UPI0018640C43|nr:E3 ubiquitin/ISG15 ligase TRIM25 isoform X1 [Megalops cyprinoides]
MADEMPSLLGLEEELTCSICLSPFDSPVTTPCGHNFCQACLDLTWQESEQVALGFNCPQCRTHFYTKPELKKNTVLSAVVEKFVSRSKKDGSSSDVPQTKKPTAPAITCDTCREAKAYKTCLTCMASFCEEHVRPHQENPVFAAHQLTEPLGDLRERICSDHYKMMEFFCVQHGHCICSACLQQAHKGCMFSTPDEQRVQKESEFRKKLSLLDAKIEKTHMIVSQMKEQQCLLKEAAVNRKRTLEVEYRQIRELLDKDEQEALKSIDKEQEGAQSKLLSLMKKFGQNVEQMSGARDRIDSLLAQTQALAFLQATEDLPSAVTFDPYTPRLSIDSKRVISYHASVVALKEHLGNILKQPVDNRIPLLKPVFGTSMFSVADKIVPALLPNPFEMVQVGPNPGAPPATKPAAKNKPQQISAKKPGTKEKGDKPSKKNQSTLKDSAAPAQKLPHDIPRGSLLEASCGHGPKDLPPSILSPAKRSDLLQYGTVLTLDPKTAHKRIALSENFTRTTVSDEPCSYPDGPARFSVCSQVLCSKGFSRGRHYWEVKMSSNNFCGIGLAYNSIDRKGPASRLGRNSQSWCVEWFNVKLSAWHASSETILPNPSPSRVGVLLDCEEGTATFYNVADRAYPIHTFMAPFSEAVYPAFWIFSSGTTITLCKLTN